MKRSLSAPCLAEGGAGNGIKKAKEESAREPTGREYLQLALARVLELQRQVKEDTYTTDSTSDLGESDSDEDVMKEVLIKVFKDLPGSSSSVASVINRATRPQPPELRQIRDKRVQLSGYDTCRRVALDFMNTVVKNTPVTESDYERFEIGMFSMAEGRTAGRKIGLTNNRGGQSTGNSKGGNPEINGRFSQVQNPSYCKQSASSSARRNERNVDQTSQNNGNGQTYLRGFPNSTGSLVNLSLERETNNESVLSRDYQIRVRMLKGLDLHLANRQRDFTVRLMRQ
ncbi:uncharacterized protein LOC124174372 isoform X5 [Neodiprion fabricii]|uniref:uncharacterized protein LOC124174372 isoform X5 n=1 Tax=Neodiprion fabricii TaxID=2872261 RepID=UPI001ED94EB8|nr:uncharacterized protein LOC124174372 isoform X5 [Neodiprion fabricii]